MKRILSLLVSLTMVITAAQTLSFAENDEQPQAFDRSFVVGNGDNCSCDYKCTDFEDGKVTCVLNGDCTLPKKCLETTWWQNVGDNTITGIKKVWDFITTGVGSAWNGITWLPRHAWRLLGKDFETIRNSVNGFSCWEHIGNVAILFLAVRMLSN